MTHGRGVQSISHQAARLYLHPPQAAPALHEEVIGMVVSVRLGHHKAETHGFAHKRHFAQIASIKGIDSLGLRSLPGKPPLTRWNASARSALGCVHMLK